ncbi:EpsG family protein [Flavobacterium sp. N1719]|uniref:EpsG family protein n=1 Tax=Flavobacterium sp. N1719 TaxID=2885633 RepID=UPI002221ED3D|nr:EpsG family protein [Flavobacterium sp. N1719]
MSTLETKSSLRPGSAFGFVFLVYVLLFMGLRPISYRFGDMLIYNIQFQNLKNGFGMTFKKDVVFEYFMYFMSRIGDVYLFFFACCVLYVLPLYAFSKKIFQEYWAFAFVMLMISFSFWSYGTNGIRNGIATSIFLYGCSRSNRFLAIFIVILSMYIHKSLIIPVAAYFIVMMYNNPKAYFYFWLACIPLSLLLGGFFTNLFLSLGIVEQDRVTVYLDDFNQASEGVKLKVGFRWDFLLYSAVGVFVGWYFVFKKKFEDKFYHRILSMYLIANAFWVIVIKANYSNRFAYLSWFMLGVVIIYPFLKVKYFDNQNRIIAAVCIAYFTFTYLLEIVLIS